VFVYHQRPGLVPRAGGRGSPTVHHRAAGGSDPHPAAAAGQRLGADPARTAGSARHAAETHAGNGQPGQGGCGRERLGVQQRDGAEVQRQSAAGRERLLRSHRRHRSGGGGSGERFLEAPAPAYAGQPHRADRQALQLRLLAFRPHHAGHADGHHLSQYGAGKARRHYDARLAIR